MRKKNKIMKNLGEYKKYVDDIMDEFLPKTGGHFARLHEAMRYSACQGGKRIRPILMRLAYEAVGGNGDTFPVRFNG